MFYVICTALYVGHPVAAVQHLLAAKYLVELMGGPRHPELVTVYFRLVGKERVLQHFPLQCALTRVEPECSLTHCFLCPLTGIYDEIGEYEIAQQCLARAKRLSPNVAKQCMISATIAEMHDKMVSSA